MLVTWTTSAGAAISRLDRRARRGHDRSQPPARPVTHARSIGAAGATGHQPPDGAVRLPLRAAHSRGRMGGMGVGSGRGMEWALPPLAEPSRRVARQAARCAAPPRCSGPAG